MKTKTESFRRDQVLGIMLAIRCAQCEGDGRVKSGGVSLYGELVPCPFCDGRGYNTRLTSIDDLRLLLEDK
jgi:hypothetical protein